MLTRTHLKHGQVALPVDLISRWVEPAALLCVSLQDVFASHVLQAEFTHIKLLQSGGKKRKKNKTKMDLDAHEQMKSYLQVQAA